MQFYSTKKQSPVVDFKTALFQGIASDRGLYMPQKIPQFTAKELSSLTTLQEVGVAVLRKWIAAKEIPDKDLQEIVMEAFTFPIPLVSVGEYSVLELFHGPTMAFKDIAARVLARLFEYYMGKEKRTATILVATSGDTGGAIAQAFSGMSRVKVVVLYPKGRVSELQEEQLTRVDENVTAISIDGTFDDCQQFVKRAFQDADLKKYNLSSANSINIGRLLPQIIYYVWAYAQSGKKSLRFVVPSGNMGNATAGLFAWKMGVPIDSFVIANNENDIATRYFQTGIYEKKKTVQTLSTAMDIGRPSNFERILELFHHNHKAFCDMITAIKVSDKKTVATIKNVYEKQKYLLDFHTAVGFGAAEETKSSVKTVIVATASPLKFAKEMKEKTGIFVDNSHLLKSLRMKEKRVFHASNDHEAVKNALLTRFGE